jgi:hypothetical protein
VKHLTRATTRPIGLTFRDTRSVSLRAATLACGIPSRGAIASARYVYGTIVKRSQSDQGRNPYRKRRWSMLPPEPGWLVANGY